MTHDAGSRASEDDVVEAAAIEYLGDVDVFGSFEDDEDELDEPRDWYVLDFIPFHPSSDEWGPWEDYFEHDSDDIKEFANNVIYIVLVLAAEYGATVSTTRDRLFWKFRREYFTVVKDLSHLGYRKLSKLIHKTIEKMGHSVNFDFPTLGMKFEFHGDSDVVIYEKEHTEKSEEFLTNLRRLADGRGLFLKHYENDGEKISLFTPSGEKVVLRDLSE